jgi:hypothetical protein
MTRYAGVAVLVAGAGVLLARRRWRDAAVLALPGLLACGGWMAVAGGSGRPVALHAVDAGDAELGMRTVTRWLVPGSAPLAVRLVVVAVALAALAAGWLRRHRTRPRPGLDTVLGVFALSYLAVVVAYRLLLDVTGRFDARLLVPLHVVLVMLVVPVLARARPARLVAGVAAALVALQLAQAAGWVADGLDDDGLVRRGYSAAAWRQSAVVAAVSRLPAGVPVRTNGADALWLLTGRSVPTLPPLSDRLTGRPLRGGRAALARMGYDLARSGGLIAYFGVIRSRPYLPSEADIRAVARLEEVRRDEVGVLYRVLPDGS